MRRRIRLTGRRQLTRATVAVKIAELPGKRVLSMTLARPDALKDLPPDSRVTLRLTENKLTEVADFGVVGKLRTTATLDNQSFAAPSCQLRIAAVGTEKRSLLLASTDTWTLRADEENKGAAKGLLYFMPKPIAPRAWSLEIQEFDYPIVYVDDGIPDAQIWARTDPVFVSCVLPAIIEQVFDDIFKQDSDSDRDTDSDTNWVADWIRWADQIMPGESAPFDGEAEDKCKYIKRLIDSFCGRHDLLPKLLAHLDPGRQMR